VPLETAMAIPGRGALPLSACGPSSRSVARRGPTCRAGGAAVGGMPRHAKVVAPMQRPDLAYVS
jgi:hypothetical protein